MTNEKANSSNRLLGPILCAIAAALWSTSALFAKSKAFEAWPIDVQGGSLGFWRAVFALVLLIPLVRRVSWNVRMIPMTICFALMNWSYLSALVGGPSANAIWLQNLAPAWVMLVAAFVLAEPTIRRDWIMLAMCISGVVFIVVMQLCFAPPSSNNHWWAPWLAIFSGICYAGVILSLRSLREHDPAWLISLNHIVTALAMMPIAFSARSSMPEGSMWFLLAGLGMIQMGTPYLLFARGLKTTPSHVASLITLLEPVLLPVWVHLARSGESDYQPPPWWTLVGGGMILVGLVLRYAWPEKKSV